MQYMRERRSEMSEKTGISKSLSAMHKDFI